MTGITQLLNQTLGEPLANRCLNPGKMASRRLPTVIFFNRGKSAINADETRSQMSVRLYVHGQERDFYKHTYRSSSFGRLD